MPGSQTTPSSVGTRNIAPADFAFRQVNNVGTRIYNGFAAQWLAYTLPHRRFADVLTDACARIRGDVDCYSFIAVDFHHILLAGFSRRTHCRYGPATRSLPKGDLVDRLQDFDLSLPCYPNYGAPDFFPGRSTSC